MFSPAVAVVAVVHSDMHSDKHSAHKAQSFEAERLVVAIDQVPFALA
jgi:hypothetical protein